MEDKDQTITRLVAERDALIVSRGDYAHELAKAQAERDKLAELLREAVRLGLRFDIGSAYIRRAYIDHQDDLVKRIASALGD